MEALRQIYDDAPETVWLSLPPALQHRRVEIIVLPLDETQEEPPQPLKALLESDFIGCFEAEPELSANYKAEFGKLLDEKYGHR